MTTPTSHDGPREQPGRENALERYDRLFAAGEPTGWAAFCTVPEYCTRQCIECGRAGRDADAAAAAKASGQRR